MRRSRAIHGTLNTVAILAIAGALFGTLWWFGRYEPPRSTPKNWVYSIEMVEECLSRADMALNAGDTAKTTVWIDRAREQAVALKCDIQADHAAWVAQCY